MEGKKPLEGKLKDSLKLAQWDHAKLNYFRLKDTIEKSHRALLKISKAWNELLQQPVREALTLSDDFKSVQQVSQEDEVMKYQPNESYISQLSVESKSGKYLDKFRVCFIE